MHEVMTGRNLLIESRVLLARMLLGVGFAQTSHLKSQYKPMLFL